MKILFIDENIHIYYNKKCLDLLSCFAGIFNLNVLTLGLFGLVNGDCSGNPSEGCIVIQDQNTRYKIKSGATLKVTS